MKSILLIIVILLLLGGFLRWGYRRDRRYSTRRVLGPIRFLGILVVLLVVVAGIGYHRGWFHAESHDANGQHTITLTADKGKFNQDTASARQEMQDLGHK